MKRKFVYMMVISTLILSSCRGKTSDLASSKREYPFDMPFKCMPNTNSLNNRFPGSVQGSHWNPADVYLDNFADWYLEDPAFSTPQWAAKDWIPFDLLKLRRLNSDQISQIYGSPIRRNTFIIIPWDGYEESDDEFYILERVRNPNEVIHEFVWTVDSVRELKMYCMERSEGVYTPVFGYQYNIDFMSQVFE